MTPPPGETRKFPRQRGRGWLLSAAAILTWEAVLTLTLWIRHGPPDSDSLYWNYGPMLTTILVFGTPLTYLAIWRRPRPYWQVTLFALPIFLLCLVFANRQHFSKTGLELGRYLRLAQEGPCKCELGDPCDNPHA